MPVFTINPSRVSRFVSKKLILLAIIFSFTLQASAIFLTCPQDYTIVLPVGSCGTIANFDTIAFGTSAQLIDTVFIPGSGTYLETGTTSIILGVVDVNGNFATCTFNVTVLVENTTSLSCPPSVQLSLDGLCERDLVAEDVLGANAGPCPGDYMVQMLSPAGVPISTTIDAFDINSTFSIRLTHLETFSICETQATVTGGTPPSMTCPPPITIHCNQPIDSSFTGVPELTGCYDDVALAFTDDLNEVLCPDSFAFQIMRAWVSTDPFGKEDVCLQVITGMRYDVTLVQFPPDYDGTDEPPVTCNDTLSLEEMTSTSVTGVPIFAGFPANGGLHCRVIVTHTDFQTHICGVSYEIKRVWDVVKVCQPSLTLRDTQTIVVLDEFAPVFEIPDTIFVSLSSDCADSLFMPAPEIIAECSSFDMTIETPWDTLTNGENILFFSPLSGNYPVLYRLTDACSNTSEQTAVMHIDNQTLVSCPPDDTINCNFYQDTIALALAQNNMVVLALLGMPEYPGNCDYTLTEVDSFQVSSCGEGFVQRRITNSSAANPVTCTQNITVVHVSNFEVQFPADTSVCGPPATGVTGQPIIINADCENVSFTFTNQTVQSGFPGCYTVYRTWEVVNSCNFEGETGIDDPETGTRRFMDGGDGYITYEQTIHVNSLATPTFLTGCELPDIYLDADTCSAMVTLAPPATMGCGSNLQLTVNGGLGAVPGSAVEVDPGTYTVNWKAVDACGNIKTCSTTFEVFDTIAPVAACMTGLVVDLYNGTVQVWASDFDNGSTDNCGSNHLDFSFSADPSDYIRTFHCCVNQGSNELEMWVTDEAGNQDSCSMTLIVQDGTGNCDCGAVLSGVIETEVSHGINQVTVNIVGDTGFSTIANTATYGSFGADVPQGNSYTITPAKNTQPLNGVTTFDAVLMTRHILGMQLLGSPYKIIAADVNNSGSVTTLDAVEMRRLILGITTQIPNNTSWRFVDAAYTFVNPANPLAENFPEAIGVNNVSVDVPGLDFIGLKVGDLNNSADPAFNGNQAEDRTFEGNYPFFIQNLDLESNTTFEVPVFAAQNEVHGFQFALAYDSKNLELLEVRPGFVDELSFGKNHLDEGILKLSWVTETPFTTASETPAFTLVFRSKTNGKLDEQLRLEPAAMQAEAYSATLYFLKPQLVFDEITPSENAFRLLGHRPNPFSQSATVTFFLPEAGEVKLTVFDPSGKILHSAERFFENGPQEFEIPGETLPGNGLIFYRLESASGTAESRLIKN